MAGIENMTKEQSIELYKSFLGFVTQAVSISILLNGGALIAILSFIGNIEKNIFLAISKDLKIAASFFVLGVVLGGSSAILGYLTQFTYFKEEVFDVRPFYFKGTMFRIFLVGILFSSIVCFAIGALFGIIALPTQL